ncbi:MAG: hypothetical protein EA412_02640 [Chitinophagaceae bacterium]|nr:MAG: hypothetical protein EA412_02640 [Chitinophagaceae bacterium]
MKISGFSMVKNGYKLYYPIKEAIQSILPIVDEFVIAVGDCDEDDKTIEIIEGINSSKIKIIHTKWDLKKYPRGMENAHQTDIAKSACTGDWLFYLQADEVVHEKYLDVITKRCEELYEDKEVEGLLFKYKHFWGDYNHYHRAHGWYPYEIRIVRNDPEIHSWESAQSFRRIPGFDMLNYRQKEGTYKLNVALVDAEIYHYGFVRPPDFMQNKTKALADIHQSRGADEKNKKEFALFDYGPLGKLEKFKETHPAVMQNKIESFDWADMLNYTGSDNKKRKEHRHERFKNRFMTLIENTFFGGEEILGFKNYNLLKNK